MQTITWLYNDGEDATTAYNDTMSGVLDGAGLKAQVLESLLTAIQRHLDRRAAGRMTVGAVVFSNEYGGLGMTAEAEIIRKEWA